MNDKAIRSFVVGLFVLMPCCADAVLGDFGQNDNFGKRGSPEQIDTVYVRPPPPELPLTPVADIGLEIVEGSLFFDHINSLVWGEMFNNSSLNALRPRGRLLSVDTDGTVLAVVESSNWNNGWDVDVPPGSRRPFFFIARGSNFGLLNESNTDIQFAVSGTSTAVLFNTDLVLVTETLTRNDGTTSCDSFLGSVWNTGSMPADDVEITLIAKGASGQVLGFESIDVNFGDPIAAGETGAFSVFCVSGSLTAPMTYYIRSSLGQTPIIDLPISE